jgi:hypothetical protein
LDELNLINLLLALLESQENEETFEVVGSGGDWWGLVGIGDWWLIFG